MRLEPRHEIWIAVAGAVLSIGVAWAMIQDLHYETEKQWDDIEEIKRDVLDLSGRVSRNEGLLERTP